MIGRALLGDGGAIGYAEVGAYRYLVHIAAENAPHDRMRAAVDRLIEYDRRRRTALLDTLERYLAERRSVIESARALFIHPNTLRQRLGRIEELTGLSARRGRPAVARAGDQARPPARAPIAAVVIVDDEEHREPLGRWRTRWGSWVHSRSPTNRLRSASAVITIASQSLQPRPPRRSSWWPCGCRARGPRPSNPLRLRRLTALATRSRCCCHSRLVGSSPGLCIPNATPCTRAIENTCTVAPSCASSITRADRRVGDLTPLGREQDPLEPLALGRLASRSRPRPSGSRAALPRSVAAVIVPAGGCRPERRRSHAACPRRACDTSRRGR